jgi:subtilisin family serine protease
MPSTRRRLRFTIASFAAAILVLISNQTVIPQSMTGSKIPSQVRDRAAGGERIRVLVRLNVPGHAPEGTLPNGPARINQRARVTAVQARVLSRVSPSGSRLVHRYSTIPYLALEVNSAALAALEDADVVQVVDDAIVRPVLMDSVPLIQGDQVWDAGYDGSGTSVAVLDTGVEASHPFLSGKLVAEACFSSNQLGLSQSFCPNGRSQQIGAGSARPCVLDGCMHGTHVAGIAAGNGAGAGQPFSGVAKGANVVAVQVFSEVTNSLACGGLAPCLGGFTSDIIAGLEWVYSVAPAYHVASVNMSLGEGQFFSNCDSEPYKPAIDLLRSIGVASVAAAGNDGYTSSTMTPACVSTAVSVGASDKSDYVTWFSNVASFLSLFAPGDEITSSVPGGGFESVSGTSMASPHVAGAFALLRQAVPAASVTVLLDALRTTGHPITDIRDGGTVTVPRVAVFEALATLIPLTNPSPSLTSMDPPHIRASRPAFTLTLTGTRFNAFSVARWNGADRPTTVVNTTTLEVSIPASDLQLTEGGTAEVTVFTPSPGGGTSTPLTFVIDPPPSLTVSATSVAGGLPLTATLVNGFGGQFDWLSLSPVGSPYVSASNIRWTYVGAGLATMAWTVNMPTAPGQYEFRLFLDNVYDFSTKSPAVTVTPALNPIPVVTSLSPNHASSGGPAFTLKVTGTDFKNSSVVRWNGTDRTTTYSSATELRASIGAADIASPGTATISVFTPEPGGGTSGTQTFTIDPGPSLSVNPTTAAAGAPVTVTLVNGYGGAFDWIGLYSTGAADTTYRAYTYVGTGVTTRTWTTNMPTTPGTYEFRLFLANGYTRVATSPAVTVTPGTPVVTSLSPVGSAAGAAAFTLTVNGSNFQPLSVVRWNGAERITTYVSGTQLRAVIPAIDIVAPGNAQVTVFTPPPGGGTSGLLSFSIGQQPTLTAGTSSVTAGGSISVTLQNGAGGAQDWLSFAATTAANNSYVQWVYVGTSVTNRTWTVTAPSVPGAYEFRLFANGGYTRLATSTPITVTAANPPVLTVSATSIAVGSQVTVTLANGLGGSMDWIGLAATTAANTSYLQWVYVGTGVTARSWTVTLNAAGTYEFRLFLNNGYTRVATSPAVTVGTSPP